MEEIWKEYKTYGSNRFGTQYLVSDIEISNLGNVKINMFNKKTDVELEICKNGPYAGRYCICGKPLFRLVYELFVGPIPKGKVIHHKDHNKLNDALNNLQLMNKSEHTKIHSKDDLIEKNKKRSKKLKGLKKPKSQGIKLSEYHKGTIWMNNGVKQKLFHYEIEAFVFGYFFKGRIKKEE